MDSCDFAVSSTGGPASAKLLLDEVTTDKRLPGSSEPSGLDTCKTAATGVACEAHVAKRGPCVSSRESR